MNKKNCAFTICSRNYITLARLLKKSIEEKSNNCDFYICIADEFSKKSELKPNEFICKQELDFTEKEWYQLSFKYDVTEFCTFLKPFCFAHFQEKYDNVCYIDPDIMFFDNIQKIFDEFASCEFLLTPHISDIKNLEADHVRIEDELRGSGLYNFGFLGLKTSEDTKCFIEWWKNRLTEKCYRDSINYLYTDQVWGNYIMTYFDLSKIKIQKNLGWNIAPWNFSERKILLINGKYKVINRRSGEDETDILFVHYSGYDYKSLCAKAIVQKNQGHETEYKDIELLLDKYAKELKKDVEELSKYLQLNYMYNYYSDGVRIHLFHRRLYRMMLLENKDVGNPFEAENKAFYLKLKKARLLKNASCTGSASQQLSNGSIKKLKVINLFMRTIYKFIGLEKYISLLKFLKGYGQFENQIHLIEKDNNVLWYRRFIIQ